MTHRSLVILLTALLVATPCCTSFVNKGAVRSTGEDSLRPALLPHAQLLPRTEKSTPSPEVAVLTPEETGIKIIRPSRREVDQLEPEKVTKKKIKTQSLPEVDQLEPEEEDEIQELLEELLELEEVDPDNERLTQTQLLEPPSRSSETSCVVVLGATGRIGRRVVAELQATGNEDLTIVAVVRDIHKASGVISPLDENGLVPVGARYKGPKIVLVHEDLVPRLFTRHHKKSGLDAWYQFSESSVISDDEQLKDIPFSLFEQLQDAIDECNAIISCVGTVRTTNFLLDFLPWRLFSSNARRWCNDPNHPFFVNYETTRMALHFAEETQRYREESIRMHMDNNKPWSEEAAANLRRKFPDRIRFIRISDLCVTKKPWHLVTLVTNLLRSMVFRYHDMAERLLEKSEWVDSIILRPGSLTDAPRNPQRTHVQVSDSGQLPYPAKVSRDDVASLAAASALFKANKGDNLIEDTAPFHMKLAVRWCGRLVGQGKKSDGRENALNCLRWVIHKSRVKGIFDRPKLQKGPNRFQRFVQQVRQRKAQNYALYVAIPVYLTSFLVMLRVAWAVGLSNEWDPVAMFKAAREFPLVQSAAVGGASLLQKSKPLVTSMKTSVKHQLSKIPTEEISATVAEYVIPLWQSAVLQATPYWQSFVQYASPHWQCFLQRAMPLWESLVVRVSPHWKSFVQQVSPASCSSIPIPA